MSDVNMADDKAELRVKKLTEERDMWHERWRRSAAFEADHRARLHKGMEELGELPEQQAIPRFKRWSNRYLGLIGLRWLRT